MVHCSGGNGTVFLEQKLYYALPRKVTNSSRRNDLEAPDRASQL